MLGSILMVTTHANTKRYPTEAWVWWVNSYTWKHLDKKGERELFLLSFCIFLSFVAIYIAFQVSLQLSVS